MKTKKTNKSGPVNVVNAIATTVIGLSLMAGAALAFYLYQKNNEIEHAREAREQQKLQAGLELRKHPYPKTIVNDSVAETVKAAAKNGWVPCPGLCLKLATPGWHHRHMEGFADTDYWMTFPHADGRITWVSQRHSGHVMHDDGSNVSDIGACTTCGGTGWVRSEAAHDRRLPRHLATGMRSR